MSVSVYILPVFRRLLLRNQKGLNVCFETNEHSVQKEDDNSEFTALAF